METHADNCRCDPCCNRRIGRPLDAHRSAASRSVVHERPTHLIRKWSGKPADEAPLCGSKDGRPGTEGRDAFDCAGNPMPLCAECLAVA